MKKCQHCNKNYAEEMSKCPFCGGENIYSASEELVHCPRCKAKLQLDRFRETNIFECSSCHGIWLNADDFNWLTSERDVYADSSIPRKYTSPPIPDVEGYLPCAVCAKLMPRSNFKGASGVLIDTCKDHGVWLDQGELEKIRSYIAAGKNTERIEKLISENSNQIRILAKDVKDLSFMQKMLHRYSLKRIFFSS